MCLHRFRCLRHHLFLLCNSSLRHGALKGLSVPSFEARQQLLLNAIHLRLRLLIILLVALKLAERVAVGLLGILHLAQQHKLLLIDDLFRRLTKFIVRLHLIVLEAQFTLVLLAVNTLFQLVDLLFHGVEVVGHILDLLATLLATLAERVDLVVDAHAFIGLLELEERFLLVDGCALGRRLLALMLRSFVLLIFRFLGRGGWLAGQILRCFALGRGGLRLFDLFKGFGVSLKLSLDSVDVLLSAPVLVPDLAENLTHLPQRVNVADVLTFRTEELLRDFLNSGCLFL